MRIGVAAISGRMGRLVAEAIPKAGATLAGGTGRSGGDSLLTPASLANTCDALIDFTHPDTVSVHADAVRQGHAAWILGTTGLSSADQNEVDRAARHVAVVQAANFAPGMCLVLAMAGRLACALPATGYDAEILEAHHRDKRDAPSGTALALGDAVARGRGVRLADVARSGRHGQSGKRQEGEIGLASLRGGRIVGEHTVVFAGDTEIISLSHSALDRAVFAQGAVRAALWAGGRRPGLYDMTDVLGLRDAGWQGHQTA